MENTLLDAFAIANEAAQEDRMYAKLMALEVVAGREEGDIAEALALLQDEEDIFAELPDLEADDDGRYSMADMEGGED